MYYRPSTTEIFTLHGEIRSAMWATAGVMFGNVITDDALAEVGVFRLRSTPPVVDAGQVAEPVGVEFVEGEWVREWAVRDATPEEIEAMKPPVPQQITSGQGREALYDAGLFANVQPAIDAIEDADTKWRVQNAWDNRPTWERQSPFVAMMAGILGLDSGALDQLFITAAAL